MRHVFAVCLMCFVFASCAYTKPAVYTEHEMQMRDYVWRIIVQNKTNENKFKTHLPPLRPQDSDIKIFEYDLNGDGKQDFLATVDHFLYENNGFPLFIMIADDFGGYTPLPDAPRIDFFDVSVMPHTSGQYPELIIACKIYAFNGFTYKEVK